MLRFPGTSVVAMATPSSMLFCQCPFLEGANLPHQPRRDDKQGLGWCLILTNCIYYSHMLRLKHSFTIKQVVTITRLAACFRADTQKSEFPLTVLQLLHYQAWYSELHCFCHKPSSGLIKTAKQKYACMIISHLNVCKCKFWSISKLLSLDCLN